METKGSSVNDCDQKWVDALRRFDTCGDRVVQMRTDGTVDADKTLETAFRLHGIKRFVPPADPTSLSGSVGTGGGK
jgi:hypothetical protein